MKLLLGEKGCQKYKDKNRKNKLEKRKRGNEQLWQFIASFKRFQGIAQALGKGKGLGACVECWLCTKAVI